MCRWVGGAATRVALLVFGWTSLLVIIAAVLDARGKLLSQDDWLMAARWTLFAVVYAMVAIERAETQRWLDGLAGRSSPEDDAAEPEPPTVPADDDEDAPSPVGTNTEAVVSLLSLPLFVLWLRWGEPAMEAEVGWSTPIRPWSHVLILAFLWASVTGGVAALWRASVALAWARATATSEAAARLAPTARAQPLFMGILAACVLLPTLLGKAGVAIVVVVALMVPLAALWALQQTGETRELLVTLGPDDTEDEIALPVILFGGEIEREVADRTWVVRVPKDRTVAAWRTLRADTENVDHIELNAAVSIDPTLGGGACAPDLAGWGAGEATVAVVDTGVQSNHPGLRGRTRRPSLDRHGHGTAMAGMAVSAGAAVRVLSVPALAGNAAADDVAEGIHDAIDGGAGVINLSFTGSGPAPWLVRRAVERALTQGIAVVAAAGNRGGAITDELPWPASIPGVLAVTSIDRAGRPSAFSKTAPGAPLRVAAIGEQVCAPSLTGGWETTSGTSAAAAWISGSIAALHAACGDAPADLAHRMGALNVAWTPDDQAEVLARCAR